MLRSRKSNGNRKTSKETQGIVNSTLFRIHKKIEDHLQGKQKFSLGKATKLAKILTGTSTSHNLSLREKRIAETSKNILLTIRKELIEESQNLQRQASSLKLESRRGIEWSTRSRREFMDLFAPKGKEDKENVPLASKVIKLKCGAAEEDKETDFSFPLELLTNDNFLTQKQTQKTDIDGNNTESAVTNSDVEDEQPADSDDNTQLDSQTVNVSSTSQKEISDIQTTDLQESQVTLESNFSKNISAETLRQNPSPAPSNCSGFLSSYITYLENKSNFTADDVQENENIDDCNYQSEEADEHNKSLFIGTEENVVEQTNILKMSTNALSKDSPIEIIEESCSFIEDTPPSINANETNNSLNPQTFTLEEAFTIMAQPAEYNFEEEQQIIFLDGDIITMENNVGQNVDYNEEVQHVTYEVSDIATIENMDMDMTDVDNNLLKDDTINQEIPYESQVSFSICVPQKPSSLLDQTSCTQTSKPFNVVESNENVIIIDETIYNPNGSHKSPKFKSPYKNMAQSSSFLSYKSQQKSQASLASPKRMEMQGYFPSVSSDKNLQQTEKQPGITLNEPRQVQSENLMFVKGAIPKKFTNNSEKMEEETFEEKQKKLEEKVMKRREKYKNQWNDMPMKEKVSKKFIEKFHVNVFEDPVEALTNIDYKPNFSNGNFPRLTTKQLYEGLQSVTEKTRLMDTALTNVINKLKEKNNNPNLATNAEDKSVNSSDDSDSGNEARKANKRWLKEHRAEALKEAFRFMEEPPSLLARRRNSELKKTYKGKAEEEKDVEKMISLMSKLGNLDWLDDTESN